MADNKDFVVSDRRRFGTEGDRREDVRPEEEEKTAAATTVPTPPPPATQPSPVEQAQTEPATEPDEAQPGPPTAEEERAQSEAYKASGKKLDELVGARLGNQEAYPEMNFSKVVESLYMSALIQMGALRSEGEPPRVDIIGARQTIDSITVLQEKTKGNLTDQEQTLLQNALFELRMAWIELTNAIARGATQQPGSGPGPATPPMQK